MPIPNAKRLVLLGHLLSAAFAAAALAGEDSGSRPGDETLSCAQIAAELLDHSQELMPAATAAADAATQVMARGQERMAEVTPVATAFLAAQTLAHLDPTGLSGRAVQQASKGYQQEIWQRSIEEDAPLNQKFGSATESLVLQGQAMQGNARLQRLLQLVQEKGCDAE